MKKRRRKLKYWTLTDCAICGKGISDWPTGKPKPKTGRVTLQLPGGKKSRLLVCADCLDLADSRFGSAPGKALVQRALYGCYEAWAKEGERYANSIRRTMDAMRRVEKAVCVLLRQPYEDRLTAIMLRGGPKRVRRRRKSR